MTKSSVSKRDSKILYVLLTAIELYLKTGQPVGSKTLKESLGSQLSTATIRNYFAELEASGFLKKNHTSGGRIPTDLAYRYYIDQCVSNKNHEIPNTILSRLNEIPEESRNITKDLQKIIELLGEILDLPVFFSSPRFENDSVINIQLTLVDEQRAVVILATEFGQIFTDILWLPEAFEPESLKRIEFFLQNYLKKIPPKDFLSGKEEDISMTLYNEIVVRYLMRYCNFSEEDLHQTGLSRLLKYEAFKDSDMLARGLSLFENRQHMCKLLEISMRKDQPTAFIGRELSDVLRSSYSGCSVIAVPFLINRSPLGAFGILGSENLPYKEIFPVMELFANRIKDSLTRSFYKFKLSFKRPCSTDPQLSKESSFLAGSASIKLLPSKEIS
ncbi:heat-inducible transcriptional repressor HrcA [Chlamydia sp. 17-3921]|uniref:heat-inducible transcriptional repressor HrcA n=1 Tax=Chlamydia sp. 17-3921 TaxID=2675798 RepID=UPI00191A760E|nr:heat-inducible transcriptional repressor HrcA [Chlamydia sp. 17-3921]